MYLRSLCCYASLSSYTCPWLAIGTRRFIWLVHSFAGLTELTMLLDCICARFFWIMICDNLWLRCWILRDLIVHSPSINLALVHRGRIGLVLNYRFISPFRTLETSNIWAISDCQQSVVFNSWLEDWTCEVSKIHLLFYMYVLFNWFWLIGSRMNCKIVLLQMAFWKLCKYMFKHGFDVQFCCFVRIHEQFLWFFVFLCGLFGFTHGLLFNLASLSRFDI